MSMNKFLFAPSSVLHLCTRLESQCHFVWCWRNVGCLFWQTNNEIRETDRAIQLVQRSIIEKEEALKVAQTRLDERTRRRCVELCRDAPMHGSAISRISFSCWVALLYQSTSAMCHRNRIADWKRKKIFAICTSVVLPCYGTGQIDKKTDR